MRLNKKSKSYSKSHSKSHSGNKLSKRSRSLGSLSLSLPSFKSNKSFDFDDLGEPSDLDTDYKTRKSLTQLSKKSFAPRIWSIGNDSESISDKSIIEPEEDDVISIEKSKKNNRIGDKLKSKDYGNSLVNKARQTLYNMSLEHSLDDESENSYLSDDYSNMSSRLSDAEDDNIKQQTKKYSKKNSKNVNRDSDSKSSIAKKISQHKQHSSSDGETSAKKQAVIYINNLRKKIATKGKKETYEIIGNEISELEKDSGKYLNILKLSKINFLLEDIHAKFDPEYGAQTGLLTTAEMKKFIKNMSFIKIKFRLKLQKAN